MKIVILSGAGISADSGIKTFRDSDGTWEGHDVMQVAHPTGYATNPDIVQKFYSDRRVQLNTEVEPNPAHAAIVRLIDAGHEVTVITQNVDNLHERGGVPAEQVLHIHGELNRMRCTNCAAKFDHETVWLHSDACPECGETHVVRPDIVWFEEMPRFMQEASNAITDSDIYIQVGTSAVVYPAAGLHYDARGKKIEVNMEITAPAFNNYYIGRAKDKMPELVNDILAGKIKAI